MINKTFQALVFLIASAIIIGFAATIYTFNANPILVLILSALLGLILGAICLRFKTTK